MNLTENKKYGNNMENLLDNLKTLLKKDERLVSEDELLKNKVIELALSNDKELIKLLLSNKKMKEIFFTEVDKILIFDKDKFVRFVSNKQFLPDSYTAFKNKIGLAVGDEFLSEKKEVVLSWPYKDCVLEGGMTKEDQKRDEIFWNEVLALDEISRLLDPKVFTNAKRIDKDGEHKFDKFKTDENGDIKDNLIIKGNNLLALHSLKKRFAGKVKLIYIDPPYNTGNDEFKYNDSFNHSTWLIFMKNRLEAAREFLREDGIIFVQCDDNEQAYLKILMDEVFKRENFISQISWERSATAGLGLGGKIINVTEYILVYQMTNSKNNLNNNVYRQISYDINEIGNYKVLENTGVRKLVSESKSASGDSIKIFIHQNYKIRKVNDADFTSNYDRIFRTFLIQKENSFQHSLISKMDNKFLYSVDYTPSRGKNKGNPITNYYYNKELFSWLCDLGIFENGKIIKNEKVNDFWDRKFISNAARGEGGIRGLDRMKKPEKLISFIIELSSKPNDIVLDYHLGSGTTCAVAHKMGRQYIGVEQIDYGENDSIMRLKNVINGDQTGISKSVGWKGGSDFVYLELIKWNENFVKDIKKAKTKDELKKLWGTMKEKAFLSYKVDVKTIDESVKDFADLSIEDQKRFLYECLDKNHLYVNYSEIDDEEYGVREEDKKINKEFYYEF